MLVYPGGYSPMMKVRMCRPNGWVLKYHVPENGSHFNADFQNVGPFSMFPENGSLFCLLFLLLPQYHR